MWVGANFCNMNNKEKDQLEVIIAELAAISQVIYRYLNQDINQDINQDLNQIKDQDLDQDLDQDKVKINPSAKDIDQDKIRFKNQDKVQDYNPELFPRIEQEMDIKASLNYIWTDQKMKFQVYHAVIPYADHVNAELNSSFSVDDIWTFLCEKKLSKHFSNPKRRQFFLTKEFSERTSWIFNTLCNVSLSNLWMKDIVDWFKKLNSGEVEKTKNHNPEPSTMNPEPSAVPQPGLSEFEFRRNGVRFYSDPFEQRDIEIPEDFGPRPDAEAWLNPHSGWMHND